MPPPPPKRRTLKVWAARILAAYLLSYLVILCAGTVDYALVARNRSPMFTGPGVGVADGGSVEYRGLGYVIMATHRYSQRPRPAGECRDGWAYDVGPRIWYPCRAIWPWGGALMRDRADLRLVTLEEDMARWRERGR